MEQEKFEYEVKVREKRAAPNAAQKAKLKRIKDEIAGKPKRIYRGRVYKKKAYAKVLPEGWDNRSWRLQVYDFLKECAEKHDVSIEKLLIDMGYGKAKHKLWFNGMKRDVKRYKMQSLEQLQEIGRYCAVPFVLY